MFKHFYIARIAVIKINGLPMLSKTDEVGDICVQTLSCGNSYWGLQGKSTHTFQVSLQQHKDSIGLVLFVYLGSTY